MPVERFADWGAPGTLPPDGVPVASDAAARHVIETARRANAPLPVLGLLGGDLCRTLGGGRRDEAALRAGPAARFAIDVGCALVDGRLRWFVAHLIARRRAWAGELFVAMNAEWCGDLCLGPRAHPGDGLLDVTRGALPIGDRIRARRRARSGDHLPHPALRAERTAATQVELPRATDIWLDGEHIGTGRRLSVRVEPAVLEVVV
jgi:hypothetical protein